MTTYPPNTTLPIYGAYTQASAQAADLEGRLAIPRAGRTVGASDLVTYLANNAVFCPLDFGAVGDGVADDTAAVQNAATAALGTTGIAGTLDLRGRSYKLASAVTLPAGLTVLGYGATVTVAASVSCGRGVRWLGGTVQWSITTALDALVPTADYCQFVDITFIGSGAIGTSGAPLYQRAINGTKYNYGVVERCRFTNMTVGVWVGGASTDPTPVGWRVVGNSFEGIVGYRGQSEGYAVLFTPASRGVIADNVFSTIARHAIYLAGGACANTLRGNTIDGTDNIAIQLNTLYSQPASADNVIAGNVIRNVTKSIAYAYLSSVGIGCYGNNTNTLITGNRITGVLDAGIQWSSTATDRNTSCVGFGALIADNSVDGSTATDSGIRVDNPDAVVVSGNRVVAANSIFGIVVSGSFAPAVHPGRVRDNHVHGLGSGTVACRVNSTAGAHAFSRNTLSGQGTLYTTTGASGGIVIDPVDGYQAQGDADLTYTVGAMPKVVNAATTLSANRVVTLSTLGAGVGATVRVIRPASGAFTLTVKDAGGSTLKTLSTGQWVDAVFDGSVWNEAGYGSL